MADDKPIIIIKKKKGGDGHGHHGGAWKVAYADFVTAMMCFFLVMWLMGADESTKAAVSRYFNDPLGVDPGASNAKDVTGQNPGGNLQTEDQIKARNDITEQNRPEIPTAIHLEEHKILSKMVDLIFEGSAFSLETTADTVRFNIPGSVLFAANSTAISIEGRRYLAKLAPVIKEYYGDVTVTGHTDDASFEGQDDLWNLSFKRSLNVIDYLSRTENVPMAKLTPAALANQKILERSPAATYDQRAKNRRVEFVFRHSRKNSL